MCACFCILACVLLRARAYWSSSPRMWSIALISSNHGYWRLSIPSLLLLLVHVCDLRRYHHIVNDFEYCEWKTRKTYLSSVKNNSWHFHWQRDTKASHSIITLQIESVYILLYVYKFRKYVLTFWETQTHIRMHLKYHYNKSVLKSNQ